jgi:glutathione S-transferase
MSLTLHFHPLSSYCQKVLIGLYELEVPFAKQVVDLGHPAQRAAFLALWPVGKFPVLRDEAQNLNLPETSIILEYLDQRHGPGRLIPKDPARARECRLRDRFFDLYVNEPMGKVVTDKLRPDGKHDPYGVEKAREQLRAAYGIANEWLREPRGSDFTMADCAAAPALFYARKVAPFGDEYPNLTRYLDELTTRPSYARVLDEAEPYLSMFPG